MSRVLIECPACLIGCPVSLIGCPVPSIGCLVSLIRRLVPLIGWVVSLDQVRLRPSRLTFAVIRPPSVRVEAGRCRLSAIFPLLYGSWGFFWGLNVPTVARLGALALRRGNLRG